MRKYELIKDDTIIIKTNNGKGRINEERVLYRVRALIDIPELCVRAGHLGGYIESENNLSQEGNCWVYMGAMVFGDGYVSGNATVASHARVYGNAQVFENTRISNGAQIFGYAQVYGNAKIFGAAKIYGHAEIFEDSYIYSGYIHGYSKILGKTSIKGLAEIVDGYLTSSNDYCAIHLFCKVITMYKTEDGIKCFYQAVLDIEHCKAHIQKNTPSETAAILIAAIDLMKQSLK